MKKSPARCPLFSPPVTASRQIHTSPPQTGENSFKQIILPPKSLPKFPHSQLQTQIPMPELTAAGDSANLPRKIAGILDECRLSHAIHARKLKELSSLRSSTSPRSLFFSSFVKALTPLFDFARRTVSSERVVRFVSAFAARRDEKDARVSDEFLEEFLGFLLMAARAGQRSARFRACQIVSEVIVKFLCGIWNLGFLLSFGNLRLQVGLLMSFQLVGSGFEH